MDWSDASSDAYSVHRIPYTVRGRNTDYGVRTTEHGKALTNSELPSRSNPYPSKDAPRNR